MAKLLVECQVPWGRGSVQWRLLDAANYAADDRSHLPTCRLAALPRPPCRRPFVACIFQRSMCHRQVA